MSTLIGVALLRRLVQKTLPNDPKQHKGRMPEGESNQQLPTCALSTAARVKHALYAPNPTEGGTASVPLPCPLLGVRELLVEHRIGGAGRFALSTDR